MRINCQHGFFKFIEDNAGDVSDFMSKWGFRNLYFENGYFTFEPLLDAPKYSIKGGTYLGAPATVTIEGEPWEVMRANGLIYDFTQDKVVAIASIVQAFKLNQSSNYWFTDGMILPGSITDDGQSLTDYAAFYNSELFYYSEVKFV